MFVTSKRYRGLDQDFARLLVKEQATFLENQILRAEVERLKARVRELQGNLHDRINENKLLSGAIREQIKASESLANLRAALKTLAEA